MLNRQRVVGFAIVIVIVIALVVGAAIWLSTTGKANQGQGVPSPSVSTSSPSGSADEEKEKELLFLAAGGGAKWASYWNKSPEKRETEYASYKFEEPLIRNYDPGWQSWMIAAGIATPDAFLPENQKTVGVEQSATVIASNLEMEVVEGSESRFTENGDRFIRAEVEATISVFFPQQEFMLIKKPKDANNYKIDGVIYQVVVNVDKSTVVSVVHLNPEDLPTATEIAG